MTSKMTYNLKTIAGVAAIASLLLTAVPLPSYAALSSQTRVNIEAGDATNSAPPSLDYMFNLEVDESDNPIGSGDSLALDIRLDALKEAALSYGARGGLATRTFEIRQDLDDKARYLDKVFDFRQLLINAPDGFMIEPPVISEAENNILVGNGGLEAAVTDRMYNINTNVKIVTAPKTWRQYLEREWGVVEPPPNILRPITHKEREIWKQELEKGWIEGYAQAEEVFESDLNMLLSHFRGMVRYKVLLAQGMVSPTITTQTNRGITGGGTQMRIGDRAVQIIDSPKLIPESAEWSPENR